MGNHRLRLGQSDFKHLREEECYYVDKSLFIRELYDDAGQVVLIPRPRRFGKTLNLSMLRYYFERSEQTRQGLFTDLAIWQQGEKYTQLQGTLPVIFVSFKDAKGETWEDVYPKLKNVISEEFKRHKQVVYSHLDEEEQQTMQRICQKTGTVDEYENSLLDLSRWLQRAYGNKQVLLLIDEYDTPIHQAYAHGYYNECIGFMRALLGSALKDNSSLERAVLTGILRVAKESIFSGLNNVRVCSILSTAFERSFGLLDAEVAATLRDFGRAHELDEFRRWYNGYRFGDETVYNPWSIFHALAEPRRALQPYWVNTSDQQFLHALFDRFQSSVVYELTRLLQEGGTIQIVLNEHVSFIDFAMDSASTAEEAHIFWNFVLLSGYLKVVTTEQKGRKQWGSLAIPNEEVAIVFEQVAQRWIAQAKKNALYTTQTIVGELIQGHDDAFIQKFQRTVYESLSYHDVPRKEAAAQHMAEHAYHMFVLGMMVSLYETHEVTSNRESGEGRYDVVVKPRNVQTHPRAFVFEFKQVEKEKQLAKGVETALAQIKERAYDTIFGGTKVPHIVHIGVAFAGKKALVKMAYV
jgi:gas vesicle protein